MCERSCTKSIHGKTNYKTERREVILQFCFTNLNKKDIGIYSKINICFYIAHIITVIVDIKSNCVKDI